MAMSRIRGAFAVPRKGETFELRAGLVYGVPPPYVSFIEWTVSLTGRIDLSMRTNGMWNTFVFSRSSFDHLPLAPLNVSAF
jgi:hypothetical protein